jgi:hypothetical protein
VTEVDDVLTVDEAAELLRVPGASQGLFQRDLTGDIR